MFELNVSLKHKHIFNLYKHIISHSNQISVGSK